ncbi:MAG TPA: nucleotidyltransferase family protein [Thermoanaerobaculia bacterium]|nr:nucleotidyltransferase family protein [Thermoanaerobaculia bacterium]
MTRDEILQVVAAHRDALHSLHVLELSLFGSHARDEASPNSDIDFLVELDQKTFDAYMDLKEYLEVLFGQRIDLVMKSALKERLRESILAEAVRAA